MVTVRTSKVKGAQYEYSVFDSLVGSYPNLKLTKQLGFVKQYDLVDEVEGIVIECKRLKGFSWNQLAGFFEKLCLVGEGKKPLLIFKANHQPT